jgi:hypothetical protein
MMMTRLFRGLGLVLVAGLVLGISSCSRGDRKVVYPVRGQGFFKGKPAEGAQVTLVPLDDNDTQTPRPGAQVRKNGSFRLSTYASYDGAPAGRYAVTILYRSPERKVDDENRGPDLLRGKYSDPQTTRLKVEVKDGTNELGSFNLE